ncbi:MAG: TPM domain-containing protein [Leptolyngbyaceae bacterium]|nr:TPM domain-containing protein [Leptolyngbyaceae bacterium]
MQYRSHQKVLKYWVSLFVALMVWAIATPALAFDNPELLPSEPTNVIDLADSLASLQEEKLDQDLSTFEQETGWKLRVLTQYEETPGRAVKRFWNLDDRSVMLIADPRGGNLLNFSVGDAIYQLLPRTFWIELQTRYGNQFYVREHGEGASITDALHAIETCLAQNGCNVVPGLPQEQWVLTLITSIVGGLVCGFAAQPRKENQAIAWQWVLIFSPLWGILFLAFGVGPVVTRTSDWIPLARNISGFALGAIAAYLVPLLRGAPSSEGNT